MERGRLLEEEIAVSIAERRDGERKTDRGRDLSLYC